MYCLLSSTFMSSMLKVRRLCDRPAAAAQPTIEAVERKSYHRIISRFKLSASQLSISSDLYRPISYHFRMRRAHGLFLCQPITTLENISYIFFSSTSIEANYLLENNVSTCKC